MTKALIAVICSLASNWILTEAKPRKSRKNTGKITEKIIQAVPFPDDVSKDLS